ncbi:hypothetical protein ACIPID_15370 [Cupriavidus sp. CER94]|uniref:hypothetical protein n=1 Tax=Cupriavidus sp. CER94 TaxID=3377036 RepID=UPI0038304072
MMKTMLGFFVATVVGVELPDDVVGASSLPQPLINATAVAHRPASTWRAGVLR